MIDHRSSAHSLNSFEIKAWKNSGLNRIRTHDLCDSDRTNWELVTLWARNIPVEGEEYKWIYESSYIWAAENDLKIWLISIYHTSE